MTAVLIAIIIVLVALPPKYDPAIRWKERNERIRRLQIERRNDDS